MFAYVFQWREFTRINIGVIRIKPQSSMYIDWSQSYSDRFMVTNGGKVFLFLFSCEVQLDMLKSRENKGIKFIFQLVKEV